MIIMHPGGNEPITIAEGENVTLRCKATGDGTLNYQWKRVSGSLSKYTDINGGKILTIYHEPR